MVQRNPRADAVIARFTDDPKLIEDIYSHMGDVQSGKTSLAEIIANYTSDPVLTAKIMTNVQKTNEGHTVHSLTAYETPDATIAANAAAAVEAHKGAVAHIVNSTDLYANAGGQSYQKDGE